MKPWIDAQVVKERDNPYKARPADRVVPFDGQRFVAGSVTQPGYGTTLRDHVGERLLDTVWERRRAAGGPRFLSSIYLGELVTSYLYTRAEGPDVLAGKMLVSWLLANNLEVESLKYGPVLLDALREKQLLVPSDLRDVLLSPEAAASLVTGALNNSALARDEIALWRTRLLDPDAAVTTGESLVNKALSETDAQVLRFASREAAALSNAVAKLYYNLQAAAVTQEREWHLDRHGEAADRLSKAVAIGIDMFALRQVDVPALVTASTSDEWTIVSRPITKELADGLEGNIHYSTTELDAAALTPVCVTALDPDSRRVVLWHRTYSESRAVLRLAFARDQLDSAFEHSLMIEVSRCLDRVDTWSHRRFALAWVPGYWPRRPLQPYSIRLVPGLTAMLFLETEETP